MPVDLEGDLDVAEMVLVTGQQEERFVNREPKIIYGANRETLSSTDRGNSNSCEANKSQRRRNRQ